MFRVDAQHWVPSLPRRLSRELSVPVTVKIRALEKDADTLDLVRRLEGAGAQLIAGRLTPVLRNGEGGRRFVSCRVASGDTAQAEGVDPIGKTQGADVAISILAFHPASPLPSTSRLLS